MCVSSSTINNRGSNMKWLLVSESDIILRPMGSYFFFPLKILIDRKQHRVTAKTHKVTFLLIYDPRKNPCHSGQIAWVFSQLSSGCVGRGPRQLPCLAGVTSPSVSGLAHIPVWSDRGFPIRVGLFSLDDLCRLSQDVPHPL